MKSESEVKKLVTAKCEKIKAGVPVT